MKGKITIILISVAFMLCMVVSAQDKDPDPAPRWKHGGEVSMYIFPDDFIFLPIYTADRGWLHLEGRYNYEDINTVSGWFGYNFSGGNKFQYTVTPMIGGLAGNTNGLAAGLELTFDFFGFTFYSESEYVFSLEDTEDDFYYNWTDFTYSPLDWLWFGLSAQRTRLYHTDLEIQRGLLIGGGYKWLGVSGYMYNIGFDDPYFILSLTVNLPVE